MRTISFKEFLGEDPIITIEEIIDGLIENEIIGNYSLGTKKYRVTFQSPKSQRAWRSGDFSEDIVYVICDSPHIAKRIAQDWIARKLDPRENDELSRKVPKNNYLRDTEKRHLDMKSRVVGSWQQVIQMLGFAVERRENTIDYIDEPELGILVDALTGRSKSRLMDGLSEMERRGLRQILTATKNNPKQWGGHGEKAAELAKELTVALWDRKDPAVSISTPAPTDSAYSYRNSIYRNKLTQKDANAIIWRVRTYNDAIKEANRLGVKKEILDGMVKDKWEISDKIYNEKRMIYSDLYKRLRIPSSHKAFDSDPASKSWNKRGFDWETYATDVLACYDLETIRSSPGFGSTYADNADYTDWAINWLWDLYTAGPPRRENTQADRYKEALSQLLDYEVKQKKMPVQQEEIPF